MATVVSELGRLVFDSLTDVALRVVVNRSRCLVYNRGSATYLFWIGALRSGRHAEVQIKVHVDVDGEEVVASVWLALRRCGRRSSLLVSVWWLHDPHILLLLFRSVVTCLNVRPALVPEALLCATSLNRTARG